MDTAASRGQIAGPAQRTAVKVPEVTAAFWVTKVITTGMGECALDFLFQNLSHALAAHDRSGPKGRQP